MRLEAKTSASNCAAGQLQVLKDDFGGDMVHVTILPNCAHRSIQRCTWMCPDSGDTRCAHWNTGHKTLSFVLPWMTVSCFVSLILQKFKINSYTICRFQIVRLCGHETSIFEKADVLGRHKSFVHSCSCLGTCEYSQDLHATTMCQWWVAWLIFVSFCHLAFVYSSSAEMGRAFCCFSKWSSFL